MRFSSSVTQLLNRGLPQMHAVGRKRFEDAMESSIWQVVERAFDASELTGFHVDRMVAPRTSGLREEMNISFELSEMLDWGLPKMLLAGRRQFEEQLDHTVRAVLVQVFGPDELKAFHVGPIFDLTPARVA